MKSIKKIIIGVLFLWFTIFFTISNISVKAFSGNNLIKEIQYEGAYELFDESINSINLISEQYPYTHIKIFINEPNNFQSLELDRPKINDSLSVSQEKIKEIRNTVKQFIYNYNLEVANDLQYILDLDDTVIGEYSFTLDTIIETISINENYISNLEYILNSDNDIDEIYISELVEAENEIASIFSKINVDSMISSSTYIGRGINVGIVEVSAVPQVSSYPSDYSNRNIVIEDGVSGVNSHTDHVTMIAAGNNGIARGSNIFATSTYGGASKYLQWMINNNVNVINTSFGSINETSTGSGTYTSEAKKVDQIVKTPL